MSNLQDYQETKFPRSKLTPHLKRKIKDIEKDLDRKPRSIWTFTNRFGTRYMFGSFCKNYDRLTVTIAYFDKNINAWV